MTGPLDGLRIVDCSRGPAGLRLTGMLADYGADVVWVEPPGGDPFRDEKRVWYSVINRGKRSVVLDLPDEVERVHDLLAGADVFVQSWRPGVAARLGLDYDTVHRRHPRLVCCSISGYGDDPRYRDLPGYESLVHAITGSMADQPGFREAPIFEALPFAAFGASYLGAIGTLAAVYRRDEDGPVGVGRHVETSLVDGALAYLSLLVSDVDNGVSSFIPGTTRTLNRALLCADEEPSYICPHTGAVGGWGRFLKLVGLDDRVSSSDSGMDLGLPLTPEEAEIVDREVPEIFLTRTRAEWMEALLAADIAVTEVLRPGECFDGPQVLANEMVVRVDDPVLGPVDQVAPPIKFARTPAARPGPAPRVGEHSGLLESLPAAAEVAPVPKDDGIPDTLLHDVRVLDLGSHHAGPYASRLLADLGADVIKLEPVRGDIQRGVQTTFRNAQANKRAIAIDLKAPETAQFREQILAWPDVVLHNMRPGAADRMGVDYASVAVVNPEVVYLHAPGWGSQGPWKDRQSFEPLQSFYLGAGFEVAGEYNAPVMPAGLADSGAGLVSAVGILMSLLARQRDGRGQALENPQLNATMNHVAHLVRDPDGVVHGSAGLDVVQLGVSATERLYQTAEGWLCLVVKRDAEFAALAATLGGAVQDGKFAEHAGRIQHDYELGQAIEAVFRSKPAVEWVDELRAAGVAAVEPLVADRRSFFRDEHHLAVGRVAERPDLRYGRIREAALMVRVSDVVPVQHRLAPRLGEHSEEILRQFGVSDAEIVTLRALNLVAGE